MMDDRREKTAAYLLTCPAVIRSDTEKADTTCVSIHLPLSKSIAARHIVMDMIGGHMQSYSSVAVVRQPDDIMVLQGIARTLGESDSNPSRFLHLHVGESGTALRLMTAAACIISMDKAVSIGGGGRICERPLSSLVEALWHLGADIRYAECTGYAPIVIWPRRLHGGSIQVNASASSQFVTALMLIGPYLDEGISLSFSSPIVSTPYILLTAEMMGIRGAKCYLRYRSDVLDRIDIPAGSYHIRKQAIEYDWSSACFWMAYVAISRRKLTIRFPGLNVESLQTDRRMADLCQPLGVIVRPASEGVGCDIYRTTNVPEVVCIKANLNDCPDLVPALVVACLLRGTPFFFSGVAHLRHKESDRLESLRLGAQALGLMIEVGTDHIAWTGGESIRTPLSPPSIQTFGDHRIAMAFALVAEYIPVGIKFDDIDVVAKSYPTFFDDLTERLGFRLSLVPSQTD